MTSNHHEARLFDLNPAVKKQAITHLTALAAQDRHHGHHHGHHRHHQRRSNYHRSARDIALVHFDQGLQHAQQELSSAMHTHHAKASYSVAHARMLMEELKEKEN